MTKIREYRETYKPFEYPQFFEYYQKAIASIWRPEEVNLNSDLEDWQQCTEDERQIIAGILRGFTLLECHISEYWGDTICKMFPKHEIHAVARTFSMFECFDKETELLTSEGWKKVTELNEDDVFAQYDLETKGITFTKATNFAKYHYKGNLHHYKSQNTDICVTPNHDLIYYNPKSGKTKKKQSKDIKLRSCGYKYPNSGFYKTDSEFGLSNLEVLLICIQSDGHLYGINDHSREDYVKVGVSKERKKERLEKILNELKIEYTKTEISGNVTNFHFRVDGLKPTEIKDFSFFNVLESSLQQRVEFIKEVIFWDGNSYGQGCYYNTNKKAIDKVQMIAALSGIRGHLSINRLNEEKPNHKTCFRIGFTPSDYTTYPTYRELEYDDFVYCVSVPKQNVVSRRNGKVAITGNCIHGQAYNYLSDTLGLNEFEEFLGDPAARKKLEDFQIQRDDLTTLAVFSGAGEGVSLFSSFAVLLGLNYFTGRFKGLMQIISWSALDESLHSHVGSLLFRELVKEEGITETQRKGILEGFDLVIRNEIAFIDNIFNGRKCDYLNKNQLINYIYYRANDRLKFLGIIDEDYYDYDRVLCRQISSWFEPIISGNSSTDFFSQSKDGANYVAKPSLDFSESNPEKIYERLLNRV